MCIRDSRSAAYISCSGDFHADNDDDAGRQQTYKTITLPLAHVRGVISLVGWNKCVPIRSICSLYAAALTAESEFCSCNVAIVVYGGRTGVTKTS